MKLEQSLRPSLTHLHKEHVVWGSNFKQKLPNHLKEINLKADLSNQNQPKKQPNQVEKQVNFTCQKNKLPSEISTLLETGIKIYYFLGRTSIENYSEIIIYEYLKSDGKHESLELTGIKGTIMAMKGAFCPRRKLTSKKGDQLKQPKRSQPSKQQNLYEVVLLLGTKSGNLKTIRFRQMQSSPIQNRSSIQNLKLCQTSLIDIVVMDPKHYFGANVCLVLSMINHVFLINFDHMNLLTIFAPTLVNCEVGLGLSLNHENKFFLQASEGGYIVFWEVDQQIQKLIRESHGATEIEKHQKGKSIPAKTEEEQNQKVLKPPTFKPSQIHHSITPISLFHSPTITGLKHCQLYGNLLLVITQGGLIKLLAVNRSYHSHLNQNEFCTLLEYQVNDGELISDAKFFPLTREIFLVKNTAFEGIIQKSGSERFIFVKEYVVEKLSRKKEKQTANKNTTFPYKPTFFKQIKRSLQVQQRYRSKSIGNAPSKCYFERIIFNSELEIERVDKVFPSIHMQCIDSIDMVEEKDVVFLRCKDFYLVGVGEMTMFQTSDLL